MQLMEPNLANGTPQMKKLGGAGAKADNGDSVNPKIEIRRSGTYKWAATLFNGQAQHARSVRSRLAGGARLRADRRSRSTRKPGQAKQFPRMKRLRSCMDRTSPVNCAVSASRKWLTS